jgi:hypothetical protein
MFKVEVLTAGVAKQLTQEIEQAVDQLGDALFEEIRSRTPVKSGTAKAGWDLKKSGPGFVIENPVPYIGVLDRGRHMTNRGMRGSLQAPKGMVGPSLKTIKGNN